MKKLIISLCVLSIILFTALLNSDCLAQEQIAGGRTPAAVTKPEVVAAANFSVTEQAKLMRKMQQRPSSGDMILNCTVSD